MKTAVGPAYACANGWRRKPNSRAYSEEIMRLGGTQ
jgi:hypothetical protein